MNLDSIYRKIFEIHKRYEKWVGPSFFLLGFLFDVFTLGRIDDPLNILSQGLYLILLFTLLYFEFCGNPKSQRFEKIFNFKDEIFHFFLGALLSAFTLFYFKSSSLSSSFIFMFAIFSLLIINELEFFQKLGILVKSTLLYLCLLTYFLYLIPLIIGKVGFFPFLFSLLVSLILLFFYLAFLEKKGVEKKELKRGMMYPALILAALFTVSYLGKLIPPIPLSMQHLGIYHNVDKKYPNYLLSFENPWWKIWNQGDQNFVAMPGDKVYVFARIFAPRGFDDKIILHFKKKMDDGYQTSDKIPLTITGGRGEGFRGFAFKENYSSGDWRVEVETINGLEIGRISFKITQSEAVPRSFKIISQ